MQIPPGAALTGYLSKFNVSPRRYCLAAADAGSKREKWWRHLRGTSLIRQSDQTTAALRMRPTCPSAVRPELTPRPPSPAGMTRQEPKKDLGASAASPPAGQQTNKTGLQLCCAPHGGRGCHGWWRRCTNHQLHNRNPRHTTAMWAMRERRCRLAFWTLPCGWPIAFIEVPIQK